MNVRYRQNYLRKRVFLILVVLIIGLLVWAAWFYFFRGPAEEIEEGPLTEEPTRDELREQLDAPAELDYSAEEEAAREETSQDLSAPGGGEIDQPSLDAPATESEHDLDALTP